MAKVMIPPVEEMDDETLMRHLELRHEEDLRMKFQAAPGEAQRKLAAPREWRTYHDVMHRLYPNKYEHSHRGVTRG